MSENKRYFLFKRLSNKRWYLRTFFTIGSLTDLVGWNNCNNQLYSDATKIVFTITSDPRKLPEHIMKLQDSGCQRQRLSLSPVCLWLMIWGCFLDLLLRILWRWFNKDLIKCLFSESRLKSHPSLSPALSVSKYHNMITTGNAKTKIQIKHRREDGDEMTSDNWWGTRYSSLKLIHQRRLSPNIFESRDRVTVSYCRDNPTWHRPVARLMIISIIIKCFMKRCSTPKITGTQTSCY